MGALKTSVLVVSLFTCTSAQAGNAGADQGARFPSDRLDLPAGADMKSARSITGIAGNAMARWHAEIAEASARFGVPIAWIEQVMRAESGGQTVWNGAPITSKAGAMGLMQLMPRTWQALRSALGLGGNPHDPHDNILAGTAYLRAMYQRFGYPGLFAAYNAGPSRYQAHMTSGQPLPAETQDYLVKVTGGHLVGTRIAGMLSAEAEGGKPPSARGSPPPGLFIALYDEVATPGARQAFPSPHAPADPLFVVRGQR